MQHRGCDLRVAAQSEHDKRAQIGQVLERCHRGSRGSRCKLPLDMLRAAMQRHADQQPGEEDEWEHGRNANLLIRRLRDDAGRAAGVERGKVEDRQPVTNNRSW
jgi:hypothetical protein